VTSWANKALANVLFAYLVAAVSSCRARIFAWGSTSGTVVGNRTYRASIFGAGTTLSASWTKCTVCNALAIEAVVIVASRTRNRLGGSSGISWTVRPSRTWIKLEIRNSWCIAVVTSWASCTCSFLGSRSLSDSVGAYGALCSCACHAKASKRATVLPSCRLCGERWA
jgi:hypothetical protein